MARDHTRQRSSRGLKTLELLPKLSIRQLVRERVLPPAPMGTWFLNLSDERFSSIIVIHTIDDPNVLFFSMNDGLTPQPLEVTIVEKRVGHMTHFLFACPKTGRTVRDLYYNDGVFASRYYCQKPYDTQVMSTIARRRRRARIVTAKLRGNDAKGPARGEHRRALVDELVWLRDNGFTNEEQTRLVAGRPRYGSMLAQVRESIRRYKAAEVRVPAGARLKSGKLLAASAAIGPDVRPSRPQSLWFASKKLEDWPNYNLPRAVLEDHMVMDIRALVRGHGIQPGRSNTFGLEWRDDEGGHLTATCRADLFEQNRGTITAVTFGRLADGVYVDNTVVLQLIRDIRPRRMRWLVLDPARTLEDGGLCELLFFRNGLWASAKAQRLVHQSQLGANRKRSRKAG